MKTDYAQLTKDIVKQRTAKRKAMLSTLALGLRQFNEFSTARGLLLYSPDHVGLLYATGSKDPFLILRPAIEYVAAYDRLDLSLVVLSEYEETTKLKTIWYELVWETNLQNSPDALLREFSHFVADNWMGI